MVLSKLFQAEGGEKKFFSPILVEQSQTVSLTEKSGENDDDGN